jgi:hypothetical protein
MSGKSKILLVLLDRGWHTYTELLNTYFKYTQRIFDLRKAGYVIDERPNIANKHACDYRLIKVPTETIKPPVEKDMYLSEEAIRQHEYAKK